VLPVAVGQSSDDSGIHYGTHSFVLLIIVMKFGCRDEKCAMTTQAKSAIVDCLITSPQKVMGVCFASVGM